MGFSEVMDGLSWADQGERIASVSSAQVEEALHRAGHGTVNDFAALISPAAAPYLEEMARLAQEITLRRFGRVMRLYVPLYLSNVCSNICTYCGFSQNNKIPRIVLTDAQIMQEARTIKAMGYDNLLLLTGEANEVRLPYFLHAMELLRPVFSHLSMEVQPLSTEDYQSLIAAGLHAVYIYQESYRKETWREYHKAGNKARFGWRLDGPDRLGEAGIRKVGLGVLVGLEDWRIDSLFCRTHLDYLTRTYWKTSYSVSFPRMRPAEGVVGPKMPISDRDFVQLVCAWRLADEQLELALSTREKAAFRDHLFPLAITHMSAGSTTNPGGYGADTESLEQFEISDERSAAEVAAMLRGRGYEPVWKDWDPIYSGYTKSSGYVTQPVGS